MDHRQKHSNKPELEYCDGHYHRAAAGSSSSKRPDPTGVLRRTHDVWDTVLYGVGSAYYKVFGR